MKFSLGPFFKILLLATGFWLISTEAHADLAATPNVVTMQAVKGDSVSRTLTLQPTEKVTNFKAIALDAHANDDSAVIAADAIKLESVPDQIPANTLVQLPLQIDLSQAQSGEFTGEIRFTHTEGSESIPITLRVKDPWQLPLVTLLIGIAIGMAVSTYSAKGKLSDEVQVSLDNLRKQIAPDRDAAKAFWERANMHLTIAQQAKTAKELTEAQSALTSARTTWHKWLQYRPNWNIQFDYYEGLCDRIKTQQTQFPTFLLLQAISRKLAITMQMAPDVESPTDFQQQLDTLAQQFNKSLQLQKQVEHLQDLATTLDSDQPLDWEDKIDQLQQKLYTLQLSDETEFSTLETELNDTEEKLKASGAKSLGTMQAKSLGANTSPELELVPTSLSVPTVSNNSKQWGKIISDLWQTAPGRLRLFYASSYLISFLLLAGGGFNELYLSKPTFGEKGLGDYFALLVLGFSAEATRNVLTQVAHKPDEAST
ncbi:hypothetical protein [Leptothoe spongobia]|uniref:Uncharacterized protein n=1 Tax=Leptothoe spongobia TAU-MAC 1115 TaxID=1967444 RepID=A0A947DII5_9CYAN|nr:hypothetical protein [Leptothoe spongobia]MBT9317671.1 hypothetical protein [Leptothoe spongobia TAU-MAC 1115]